jgi:uncharacterized Zn finger protein
MSTTRTPFIYWQPYDERLIIACPRCQGALIRRVEIVESWRRDDLEDTRSATVLCRDCGHVYGREDAPSWVKESR